MKNIITLLLLMITLSGFSQANTDFEVNNFEPNAIDSVPPVDVDNESNGYVYFDYTKELPYSKFINGQKVWIMTDEQSKNYVQIKKSEKLPVLKEVHGVKILVMNTQQARTIAQDMANYSVMDSILIRFEFRDAINNQIIVDQEAIIDDLEIKIINKDSIIANKDSIISNQNESESISKDQVVELTEDIKIKQKEINKLKWITAGSGAAVIVVVVLALLGGR